MRVERLDIELWDARLEEGPQIVKSVLNAPVKIGLSILALAEDLHDIFRGLSLCEFYQQEEKQGPKNQCVLHDTV